MSIRKYQKKPASVEALQYDGANRQAILDWTGGVQVDVPSPEGLQLSGNLTPEFLQVGHWLVRAETGIQVLSNETFQDTYEVSYSDPPSALEHMKLLAVCWAAQHLRDKAIEGPAISSAVNALFRVLRDWELAFKKC